MPDSSPRTKPNPVDSSSSEKKDRSLETAAKRFVLLSILALTALIYSEVFHFGFVFDDKPVIVLNDSVHSWRYVPSYFTSSVLSQDRTGAIVNYYRPIFLLWLRLNHALFGLNPAGWHLSTLAVHLAVTFMVYLLALDITGEAATALMATAVFALHPVHLESVAWISGVTDPLAIGLMLGSFLSYLRARQRGPTGAWWLLALVLYGAAMLAKENALVLPMLVFIYEWLTNAAAYGNRVLRIGRLRSALEPTLPFLLATAVYLALRLAVVKGIAHVMTPLAAGTLFMTLPSVLWRYFKLLVWPHPLSIYYETEYVMRAGVADFLRPCLGLAGVGLLLGLWWKRRRRSQAIAMGATWLVLPILPVLDLRLFPAGEIVHDRYLYASSIGFAILVALAWRQFIPSPPRVRGRPLIPWAAGFAVAVTLATASAFQSVYWANDLVLSSHAVAVSPANAVAKDNLAVAAWDQGMADAAIRLYRESIQENPDIWFTWYDLGYTYYQLNRLDDARQCLTRALELNDREANPYFFLGLVLFKSGQAPAAIPLILRAIQIQPRAREYHFALGVIYKSQGNLRQCLDEMRAELVIDPRHEAAKKQIAEIESKSKSPGR